MIIVAVLLLTFFISVMSVNIAQDAGPFHEITKKNGENLHFHSGISPVLSVIRNQLIKLNIERQSGIDML